MKNLVIVESPAKAKTIEKYLGGDFQVLSSVGHIRSIVKKTASGGPAIEIDNDFYAHYEIDPEKRKVASGLKKAVKAVGKDNVWLATDEDREGEAIAWHLCKVLDLDPETTKRIVFHEITKSAIQEAIKNPRTVDMNLVQAQQARQILDRIVGFELSPVVWQKVPGGKSAGRVQSPAVRLLVEREREITAFEGSAQFKVTAIFIADGQEFKAELDRKFDTEDDARKFLESLKDATFAVSDITKTPGTRNPAAPFTTSTLQQTANSRLGFSSKQTMAAAQKLYQSGKITYMRTDSVNLSKLALAQAKDEIKKQFGENYHKSRQFATKSKGAQEAHEAIRPTYLEHQTIEGDAAQKRLYELIWKRTIASQMADAVLEKTNIYINISNTPEKFIATGEVIKFDGFLKVYIESTDDDAEEMEGVLPPVKKGQTLDMNQIDAVQKFTLQPARYTEASLVKKLEELGIGRPSTYAPTISTIQKREYIVKEDREGKTREINHITLKGGKIKEAVKKENYGYEKGKLFPTDTGELVTKFLMQYFDNIMDYQFTATVEKEFDEIAQGLKKWNKMIEKFYSPFHKRVTETLEKGEKVKGEKLLGVDPKTGLNVYVKLGRFGPIAQIGETDSPDKPKFSGLRKGQTLEGITLQEALKLFEFPRLLGTYEDTDVSVGIGRFGPYVLHKSKFYSLKKEDDPNTIHIDRAIELIEAKRQENANKIIKSFPEREDVQVLNGRYGPYIAVGKSNIKIPKGTEPASLTLEECLKLAEETPTKPKKKFVPRNKKSE